MKDWKVILLKLLRLPGWLMLLLSVFCTAGLILVFVKEMEEHPIAYAVYVLSFYTLCAVSFFFVKTLPGKYRWAKDKFAAHPYGKKYLTDIGYKVRVSLYISLGVNLIYAAYNLIAGVLYASVWLGALAVYYVLLSVIRFLLLQYMRNMRDRNDQTAEYRLYRLSGILMAVLNLTLTGVVLYMLAKDKTQGMNEIFIISSAVYTFYAVTMSIIDIVRYRKYESPVITAGKMLRLAAALVSLLSLETSMITYYGESEQFRMLMISLTGSGVCLIVLFMSVYMIVHATKEIGRLNVQDYINDSGRNTDGE